MTCILCSHEKFDPIASQLRDSKKHRVVKCKNCGLFQLSPTPTTEADKAFYDAGRQLKNIAEPTGLAALRVNQKNDTERRAEFVRRLLKPKGTVLDIGSGFGFFLEVMRKNGFRPQGIEVSAFARRISERVTASKIHDLDLFKQTLDEKFDAITLFHVLEHISRPVEFLRRAKTLLKKRGRLVIEVPNLNDALLSACAPYRAFYWQRAHLAYYNSATLRRALKRAGLKISGVKFVQRYSLQNLMQWLITGRPQIEKPSFKAENYGWLEKNYKAGLAKRKLTDTLIIIAQLP